MPRLDPLIEACSLNYACLATVIEGVCRNQAALGSLESKHEELRDSSGRVMCFQAKWVEDKLKTLKPQS